MAAVMGQSHLSIAQRLLDHQSHVFRASKTGYGSSVFASGREDHSVDRDLKMQLLKREYWFRE
jgi:hypothetical protein